MLDRANMKLLLFLANAFINTFGITQPSPEQRNRMAVFIGVLLLGVVILVGLIGFVLRTAFGH